jgi:hypothetical protein
LSTAPPLPSPGFSVFSAKRRRAMNMRELILYIVVPFNVILLLIIYYWFF